jgi:hypothetical protein
MISCDTIFSAPSAPTIAVSPTHMPWAIAAGMPTSSMSRRAHGAWNCPTRMPSSGASRSIPRNRRSAAFM